MSKARKPTDRSPRRAEGEGEGEDAPPSEGVRIVSSQHLASPDARQMSELEYAMTMSCNAFSRWMTHCMAAAGQTDLNPLDILVLHNVNHREREKRLADIVFTLNVDDSHTVNHSLKKLVKAELVKGDKVGKELFYATTTKGERLCEAYRDVRQSCLVDAALATNPDFDETSRCARMLRSISGLYDQASRAASSLRGDGPAIAAPKVRDSGAWIRPTRHRCATGSSSRAPAGPCPSCCCERARRSWTGSGRCSPCTT